MNENMDTLMVFWIFISDDYYIDKDVFKRWISNYFFFINLYLFK